jgi:hypothetical protein
MPGGALRRRAIAVGAMRTCTERSGAENLILDIARDESRNVHGRIVRKGTSQTLLA